MNLKGGALLIGSLLWQDHLNLEAKDNIRRKWRNKHLAQEEKVRVSVPIRYGRLSNSNIYTMVLSNNCIKSKNGTAFIIPFKSKKIKNFPEIEEEAKAISIAEGMKGHFVSKERGTEDVWCALGILFNPRNAHLKEKALINALWEKQINIRGSVDPRKFKRSNEKPCINNKGGLKIPWPTVVDPRDQNELNELDFIICTATKATKYPLAKEIAKTVKKDNKRFYFIENFKNGINTFQDIQILNYLR